MKKISFLLSVLILFLFGCSPNILEMPTLPLETDLTTPQETTTEEGSSSQTSHEHSFEVASVTLEPECDKVGEYIASCACGAVEKREIPATNKHNYCNNVCAWCQQEELVLVASPSDYDADGDEKKDVYYCSSEVAQRCSSGVYLWAGDYDKTLSTSFAKSTISGITHWYVEVNSDQKLVYCVTVPESGVYEMVIHMRLKDGVERGAKYIVNAGKPWQQTFQTSHAFSGEEYETVRTKETLSAYMYGVKVNLVAGKNTIAITAPTDSPKTQHYRDFYFVKVGDLQTEDHVHSYTESVIKHPTCSSVGQKMLTCICGDSKTVIAPATREHTYANDVCVNCNQKRPIMTLVPSIYDADGDGEEDVYSFSASLLDICKANDVIRIEAKNYDKKLSSATIAATTISGMKHWYIDNADQYLVYRVTAPQAGEYEMILHLRMKDGQTRGAKFIVNEGTKFEQTFSTSHAFGGNDYENVRQETTESSYMYGVKVHLQAGENLIKIVQSTTSYSQHFRDFYFVKVGEIHYHLYRNEVSVLAPTCNEDGERTLSCTCGKTITLVLPSTNEHLYIEDTCCYCENENVGYGIVSYEFLSQKAGFAGGTVSLRPETSGIYTLYWANEQGKLPDYTMLGSFTALVGKVTDYVLHENTAIPAQATRLMAVCAFDYRYTYEFDIPKERLLNSQSLYTFGALSDTHQGTRYGDESLSFDRLIAAGKILSKKGSIFIGINGDIVNDNTESEYILHAEAIKSIYAVAPNLPVWCSSGNHESKNIGFAQEWYFQYTRDVVDYQTDLTPIFTEDNELDFVVEMPDGSVVIFLHQIYYDYGKSNSRLMDDAQLDWLGERLEAYKDRIVFLFFHTEMQGKVGDFNGSDALVMGADTEDYRRLDAYFKQYTNVIFFNGHSHGNFDILFSEEYGDRIFEDGKEEYATLVHIPSLAQSQLGHIVHVYEDCIVFEGYDFAKEQAIAYATFIIEK